MLLQRKRNPSRGQNFKLQTPNFKKTPNSKLPISERVLRFPTQIRRLRFVVPPLGGSRAVPPGGGNTNAISKRALRPGLWLLKFEVWSFLEVWSLKFEVFSLGMLLA